MRRRGGIRSRGRALALACGTALAATGCAAQGAGDPLARRCAAVLQIWLPPVIALRWEPRGGEGAVRLLSFEAVLAEGERRVEDAVQCVFEPGAGWRLLRAAIGGRGLRDTEVALVNSELLLRDLSEHPERLERERETP